MVDVSPVGAELPVQVDGVDEFTEPDEMISWVDVFRTADLGEPIPYRNGPLTEEIDEVLGETTRRLAIISPDLRPEHLQAVTCISDDAVYERARIFKKAGFWSIPNFQRIGTDHRKALAMIGVRHAMRNPEEGIEFGALETPPFYGKTSSSKCALFCFQMIANSILPEEAAVRDATLMHAIMQTSTKQRVSGTHKVEFDMYAHALMTDQVSAVSGMDTEYIQIRGATLGLIRKIAMGMRERRPEAKVHCTVPLQSDSFDDFWHQVVITAATSDGVWVHDPGGNFARADKLVDPVKFYKRWSTCLNIAHIFISAPKQ
jgi:hypothetical protein